MLRITLLLVSLLCFSQVKASEYLLMWRMPLKAPIALEYLTTSLEEHGYTVAHLQKCDGGMQDFGYESDFYRVVFFGKVEEVRKLSNNYPELIPYLPLKMVVFAEKDETVLTILNPLGLMKYFPSQTLHTHFRRWHNDINSIFRDMDMADEHHLKAITGS